jgi:hypothetical protein
MEVKIPFWMPKDQKLGWQILLLGVSLGKGGLNQCHLKLQRGVLGRNEGRIFDGSWTDLMSYANLHLGLWGKTSRCQVFLNSGLLKTSRYHHHRV